jgi:hypothetical protein
MPAFLLRGRRVKIGGVLRASGSQARYGFLFIPPQMGLPSDGERSRRFDRKPHPRWQRTELQMETMRPSLAVGTGWGDSQPDFYFERNPDPS